MTTRQARALRGAAASGVAVVVAATSHTIGGGATPAPWLVLTTALLAWPAATALVGRRPSTLRIAAAVAVAQMLLHAAFAAVGGTGPRRARLGHDHAAALWDAAMPAAGMAHADPAMLGAHLVAAVLTTILLAHGEALLRAVARGVRRLLGRRAFAPAPVARPRTLAAAAPRVTASVVLLSVVSRRGPPAAAH